MSFLRWLAILPSAIAINIAVRAFYFWTMPFTMSLFPEDTRSFYELPIVQIILMAIIAGMGTGLGIWVGALLATTYRRYVAAALTALLVLANIRVVLSIIGDGEFVRLAFVAGEIAGAGFVTYSAFVQPSTIHLEDPETAPTSPS